MYDNPIETTFTFRNMDSTDALKEHTEGKLTHLTKYLMKPAAAHVIFNVEGARHVAEITITMTGSRYFGSDSSNDMYASIDAAVDKIKNQLQKNKERTKDHKSR